MSRVSLWPRRPRQFLSVFALCAGIGVSGASIFSSHELCEGFVPENDLKIPVGMITGGGITATEFNDVLDRIEKLYKDEITQHGGTLEINRAWEDETVNASAQQIGNSWILNMYGGLARHATINVEGFALVACHEMGHHLGGAPKIRGWYGNQWATNEGGADYYATLKCLRRFFAEDDNAAIIANSEIDPYADTICRSQYADREDQLICLRNSLAAMSVGRLFKELRNEDNDPRFDTPDTSVVQRTNDRHPATQCRVDTYFNGATCDVSVDSPLSNTDYKSGSCYKEKYSVGWRPRCWFKPTEPKTTALF